jgi:hypothetical protein
MDYGQATPKALYHRHFLHRAFFQQRNSKVFMSRFDKMTADRYAGWQSVAPTQFEAMAKEHALRETHYFDRDTDAWMPCEVADGPQRLAPKARRLNHG